MKAQTECPRCGRVKRTTCKACIRRGMLCCTKGEPGVVGVNWKIIEE